MAKQFKFDTFTDIEKEEQEKERREQRRQRRADAERKVIEILAEDYLTHDDLTDEQKQDFIDLYEEWQPGKFYKEGKRVEHNGSVFQVNPGHGHTAQEDWKPKDTPALFRLIYQTSVTDPETGEESEVLPEWKQPTGGHDAYAVGDKVTYKGRPWESKIPGNTTTPDGDEPHNRYWGPLD